MEGHFHHIYHRYLHLDSNSHTCQNHSAWEAKFLLSPLSLESLLSQHAHAPVQWTKTCSTVSLTQPAIKHSLLSIPSESGLRTEEVGSPDRPISAKLLADIPTIWDTSFNVLKMCLTIIRALYRRNCNGWVDVLGILEGWKKRTILGQATNQPCNQ